MPAYQATTSSTTLIPAEGGPDWVHIQNRGPNSIWWALGDAAVSVTNGNELASGASISIPRPSQTAIQVIASTAAQSSPADIRYQQGRKQ